MKELNLKPEGSSTLSHRKVQKVIRLVDKDGKALTQKNVQIRQTEHSFLFGCGAFDIAAEL